MGKIERLLIVFALLALLLAACLVVPQEIVETTVTPASVATATADTLVCTVTAYTLNVRQCPGVECGAVSWLTQGEIVTVYNQRGAWYDIGVGWIHSKYCKKGE